IDFRYASTKAARSPALSWHQDWWCWDHAVTYRPAAPQVAILCFLSDTVASNERIQDTLGLDLDARVVEVDEPVLVEALVRRRRTGRRSEFVSMKTQAALPGLR